MQEIGFFDDEEETLQSEFSPENVNLFRQGWHLLSAKIKLKDNFWPKFFFVLVCNWAINLICQVTKTFVALPMIGNFSHQVLMTRV